MNLAILLNCVQEEDHCMLFADENWPPILSPWLTCSETHLVTFIVAGCISHHFYDENPSIFACKTREEKEALLVCFAKASELPHLKVSVLNNLTSISVVQFMVCFKHLIANFKFDFGVDSEVIFNAVVNVLVNGGLPEIKAACGYICALGGLKAIDLTSLVEKSPLPVDEILEQFLEIEDADIRSLSEKALLTVKNLHTKGKMSDRLCLPIWEAIILAVLSIVHALL